MSYTLHIPPYPSMECTEADVAQLDAVVIAPGVYHVMVNHQPFEVRIAEADFYNRHYQVTVNGNTYPVQIGNDLDTLIQKIGIQRGSAKKTNMVKAPMPGLLLEVFVAPGDMVEEHQPLLILEAMKMENSLLSPRQGTIKTVKAVKGTAVDKGQVLIEFE